jgi:hypothetical protein
MLSDKMKEIKSQIDYSKIDDRLGRLEHFISMNENVFVILGEAQRLIRTATGSRDLSHAYVTEMTTKGLQYNEVCAHTSEVFNV